MKVDEQQGLTCYLQSPTPLESYSSLPVFSSLNCGAVCMWRQAARGMGGAAPLSPALGAVQLHHGSAAEEQVMS